MSTIVCILRKCFCKPVAHYGKLNSATLFFFHFCIGQKECSRDGSNVSFVHVTPVCYSTHQSIQHEYGKRTNLNTASRKKRSHRSRVVRLTNFKYKKPLHSVIKAYSEQRLSSHFPFLVTPWFIHLHWDCTHFFSL